MDELPLWITLAGLVVLLLVSAFFSISETALMALNRLRLRHLVREGHRQPAAYSNLLDRTDRLLGTILLGNNLVNAAATALVTAMTIRLVGDNEWALLAATAAITFLILVFAEITPKDHRRDLPGKNRHASELRIGAPARRCSGRSSGSSTCLSGPCCGCYGCPPDHGAGSGHRLSTEELRTLVLEGGNFIPSKHRSILLNLFELEELSVDDVMIPRSKIEGDRFAAVARRGA